MTNEVQNQAGIAKEAATEFSKTYVATMNPKKTALP